MSVATEPTTTKSVAELPPFPVRRFTVEEYHRMIEIGVFAHDERSELLEGWIVPKMTRNPPHEVTIVLVSGTLQQALPGLWHIRVQSAITTATSEPEPDLSVVRGCARDYLEHHPGPRDIGVVVEVSESTLAVDRGLMKRLYARAGIPTYWIINLVDMKVEVYSDPTGPDPAPTYRQRQDYGSEDAVPLVIEGREVARIAARDLLP